MVRCSVVIPTSVSNRARDLSRPYYTGAGKSLGAKFVLQAYIRALDELNLSIDVSGLGPGDEDEMVERVVVALEQWADQV